MRPQRSRIRGGPWRLAAALLMALCFTAATSGGLVTARPVYGIAAANQAPLAGIEVFIAAVRRGRVGVPHTFGAAVLWGDSAPRPDATFSWDFGDGTTDTGATVQHTFTTRGVYLVRVELTSQEAPDLDEQQAASVTIADEESGIVTMVEDSGTSPNPVVSYAAGWNLVSGPGGMRFLQALGPLYTLVDGGDYRAVPTAQGIEAGRAYWAYFTAPVEITLSGGAYSQTDSLGPLGGYVMAGDPAAAFPVRITGATAAYTWDAVAQRYEPASTLQPGQGAMVLPAPFDEPP